MKKPLSITVITKVSTPNAGNQAVSTELIRLLERAYPDACIYAGWREQGLEQYSFARLQHADENPLRTIDGWADCILKKYESSKKLSPQEWAGSLPVLPSFEMSRSRGNAARVVELAAPKALPLPLRFYNKGLRTLKTPLDRWRGYGRNYENWLNVLKRSDLVIYSPAGVVNNTEADYLVHDLLGLRIAQRLGAKVAAVNQSIEVRHPLLLHLLSQLYRSLDAVVVRDPVSMQVLQEAGVPQKIIKLAPDTAYLARPATIEERELNQIAQREDIKPGSVGITAQPKKGFDFSGWGKVIRHLQTLGKQVFFVSHQMSTDGLVGIELQKLYGVKVLSRQYHYEEYVRVLSLLEFVISERYHTCVFSAIAGKPFIPLKFGRQSKMHGIVWFLNYPIPPVHIASADWADAVQKNIGLIYQDYDRITASMDEAMPRLRKLAEENVRYNSLSTV